MRTRRAGAGGEAGAGAAAGRRTLDFESLAFAQGGHLMANKKCDLPKGSYRTAFKARARRLGGRPLGPAACSRAARASSVGRALPTGATRAASEGRPVCCLWGCVVRATSGNETHLLL